MFRTSGATFPSLLPPSSPFSCPILRVESYEPRVDEHGRYEGLSWAVIEHPGLRHGSSAQDRAASLRLARSREKHPEIDRSADFDRVFSAKENIGQAHVVRLSVMPTPFAHHVILQWKTELEAVPSSVSLLRDWMFLKCCHRMSSAPGLKQMWPVRTSTLNRIMAFGS